MELKKEIEAIVVSLEERIKMLHQYAKEYKESDDGVSFTLCNSKAAALEIVLERLQEALISGTP